MYLAGHGEPAQHTAAEICHDGGEAIALGADVSDGRAVAKQLDDIATFGRGLSNPVCFQEGRAQLLQSYETVQLGIPGLVDNGKSTSAKLLRDRTAAIAVASLRRAGMA